MNKLYEVIKKGQKKDLDCIEIICEKFSPLIRKYARKLNYEDAYNDLQLHLIECIYKMPLESGKFSLSEAYILSYIKKTIYYEYINLSVKRKNYDFNNVFYDNYDYTVNKKLYSNESYLMQDKLFLLDIKKILNDREYVFFILKFIKKNKDREIAILYGISRQAVSVSIKNIRKKLIEYYRNKI